MCGIAGIVHFDEQRPVDGTVLQAMATQLRHRGPDHTGMWSDGPVGLAHCRLAIIDLNPEANQPMSYAGGRYVIVFNGEIYNYIELRETLRQHGCTFHTQSDTEVLLAAYAHYGAACLDHLRGMFAFAIWDRARGELFLARDRTGKKPLKYAFVDNSFVFASELKALRHYPGVTARVDWQAVSDYLLCGYVRAPRTGFEDIQKLPHGSAMRVSPRGASIWRYHECDYRNKCALSYEAAQERTLELLRESTRVRLRSDVPLGVFLSGGVDSSLIVALMRDVGAEHIRTFTIGFRNAASDEVQYARHVAQRYATEHHEFIVDESLLYYLPAAVRAYEEPFADAAGFATYFLSRLARQHVTVALSGEGGDETFAGYSHYGHYLRLQPWLRLPALMRRAMAQLMPIVLPALRKQQRNQARLLASALAVPRHCAYAELNGVLHAYVRRHLFAHSGMAEIVARRCSEEAVVTHALHPLDEATYRDQQTYLPYCMNVKVDIASMQHALEVRNPLLDQEVMAFAATLPPAFKHDGRQGKLILKSIACRYYDRQFVYRTKHGFAVPYGDWLRSAAGGMLRDAAHELCGAAPELFAQRDVERLWTLMLRGEAYENVCWALAMLGLWHAEAVRAATPRQTTPGSSAA